MTSACSVARACQWRRVTLSSAGDASARASATAAAAALRLASGSPTAMASCATAMTVFCTGRAPFVRDRTMKAALVITYRQRGDGLRTEGLTVTGYADVVVVGGGHNGLVAAAYLARARSEERR